MTAMPLHYPFARDPNDELLDKIKRVIEGVESCLVEARRALEEARAERSRSTQDRPPGGP